MPPFLASRPSRLFRLADNIPGKEKGQTGGTGPWGEAFTGRPQLALLREGVVLRESSAEGVVAVAMAWQGLVWELGLP